MASTRVKVGPAYIGPVPHPAVGIRIPEILLEGILDAFKERRVAGGLMLSFGRETAPEYVIEAPPGVYEITMGHTGTSIKKYMTAAAEASFKKGVLVEIEADHLTVAPSSIAAVRRIYGGREWAVMSREEVEKSLEYIRSEVDEAVSTSYVNFYTIDTCSLINYAADKLSREEVRKEFWEVVEDGEEVLKRYIGREFVCIGELGVPYLYRFSEEDVMRLYLKYYRSIEVTAEIHRYIKSKMGKPFGVEIAFDETPVLTKGEDMLFYLRELWERGIRPDFIAPNIGFEKRKDYRGDLEELKERVDELAAISRSFGALLSIHSGSGSTPYSGKGPGVYEALRKATGGLLKYKISGVYIELLFEILASYPEGSRQRSLFNMIFDEVYEFIRRELEEHGPLDSPELREKVRTYEDEVARGVRRERDPRSDMFRYYSFIALNLRDSSGGRYLREALVKLYEEDEEFRKRYYQEVKALTLRLIDGLHFENNIVIAEKWLDRLASSS